MFAFAKIHNRIAEIMSEEPCSQALSAPTFNRADLCAQVAPLNSYGPTGLGAALATGLTTLVGVAKRTALAFRRHALRD